MCMELVQICRFTGSLKQTAANLFVAKFKLNPENLQNPQSETHSNELGTNLLQTKYKANTNHIFYYEWLQFQSKLLKGKNATVCRFHIQKSAWQPFSAEIDYSYLTDKAKFERSNCRGNT